MSRKSNIFLLTVSCMFLLLTCDLTAESVKPTPQKVAREANLPASKIEPIADPEWIRQRGMEDLQQQQWEGQQYNRAASSLRTAIKAQEDEQDLLYEEAYPNPGPLLYFNREEYPDYRRETTVNPPVREEQTEQERLYENAYPK